MLYSVHVREPGEESSRVQMDNRRIHSVERDDRGNLDKTLSQPLPLIRDDNGKEYGRGENYIVQRIQKLREH